MNFGGTAKVSTRVLSVVISIHKKGPANEHVTASTGRYHSHNRRLCLTFVMILSPL